MPIFHNTNGELKKLKLITLDKEKALQKLVEDNLFEVLDMRFLSSEYPTTAGGRIDTLAIDSDGAPVIIEYKRNRNDNVINQALSYLKWLKAQKREFFEMLILKKLGAQKPEKLDWNNPRVICIAESYSKFDIDTLEVIPLRLELYKFHYYENNMFVLDKVNGEDEKPTMVLDKGISNINQTGSQSHSKKFADTDQNIAKINLEKQLSKAQQSIKELFQNLEKRIFELDDNIYEKVNISNVGFRISKMFAEAHIQKDNIRIYLRTLDYQDLENKIFKIPETHGWTLNRGVVIKSGEELDYVMPFIEQSYKDVL